MRPRPGETSLVCLLWVTGFSSSSATMRVSLSRPLLESCVLDGLAQKSCLVRAVGPCMWMFPVGWHSLHVWEDLSCVCEEFVFPPVPSLFWCAFGCSLPDQQDQQLYASLTLTDMLKRDISDMLHRAGFFDLLQKGTWLNKMRHQFPKLAVFLA